MMNVTVSGKFMILPLVWVTFVRFDALCFDALALCIDWEDIWTSASVTVCVSSFILFHIKFRGSHKVKDWVILRFWEAKKLL